VKLGAKSLDTRGRDVPFKFYTAYYVSIHSRRKAYTLRELLEGVKAADKNTLFHHVFHAEVQQRLRPVGWGGGGRRGAGGGFADISGAEPATIEDIRKEIVAILEPAADERRGRSEFVFVGMEPVETKYVAHTLAEFLDLVEVVPGESILYHFVTRRVLCGAGRNDFSTWLDKNFGLAEVADELSRIDPLAFNSEEALREAILTVLKKRLL
jgi:hypothetical protein